MYKSWYCNFDNIILYYYPIPCDSKLATCQTALNWSGLRACADDLSLVFELSTVGSRAFPDTGRQTWNDLPEDVTSGELLTTFRRLLKTHLFKKSFPDYLLDINWLSPVLGQRRTQQKVGKLISETVTRNLHKKFDASFVTVSCTKKQLIGQSRCTVRATCHTVSVLE